MTRFHLTSPSATGRPGSRPATGRRGTRHATSRLRGPAGLFAKGMRDSRRAYLLAGLGLGLFVAVYGASIATNYPTPASRAEAVASTQAVAAIGSMTGAAINAERLGGFLSWRVGNLMPLLIGAWSIVALSGTLAGEIRAGRYEMLASVPLSRRRIAIEKLTTHLAGLAIATVVVAILTSLTAVAFGRLPGDAIGLVEALVHVAAMALCGLVAGSLAFAVAPWVGRGAAAGIGAMGLLGAYLISAYAAVIPAFGSIRDVSWFTWTANERPIAGSWDNASLVPVAALVICLLAIGVHGFERRDIGATVRLPRLTMPGRRLLLRGPAGVAFLGALPAALAWGVAIGLYAWLVAISASGFVDQFAGDAGAARLMETFFVGLDWRTTGGMLQIVFFDLGVPFMALAAATLVAVVAADERERRLDMLLSTGVPRTRWLIVSGAGLYGALALLVGIVAIAAALGALQSGGDAIGPALGILVGGLYAAALAGVGLGVLGLGRPGLAAATTAVLALGFTLLDLVGGSLRLPAVVMDLSLTRHLGQPMAGTYDLLGILLAAALAVGGLLVGGWGLRRRDLSS